ATPYASWGVVFVADTDGESLILSGSDDSLHVTATECNGLASNSKGWLSIDFETYMIVLCNECTLKNLYLKLSAAPGAGTSYAFTLRQNEGSSTLTCTVANANTTANDLVNTVAISDGDTVDIMVVPSGFPSLADAYWGLVMYIEPAPVGWTGKISGVTNPAKVMGVAVANIAKVKGVA
ncbi:unnamed protein product, partial [marine sediment metagenome]